MKNFIEFDELAELVHPGKILKKELDARNWSQIEFAEIIGRPARLVSQIILGRSGITPETALQFSKALNQSPAFWSALQASYEQNQLNVELKSDDSIERRAYLYSRFPIKEMMKRHWITGNNNIDELEQSLKKFFQTENLEDINSFKFAAKQTASAYQSQVSVQNITWLQKAHRLAQEQIPAGVFNFKSTDDVVKRLSSLLLSPEEIRHVPKILSESGIRFVIVQSLSSSKLDGACFWLNDNSPVIALTLRYDRIDNFWFTLRHELEHVIREDGKKEPILDEDVGLINGRLLPPEEVHANSVSADFCVPHKKLENYILRSDPYIFSEKKIIAFAGVLNIHPGLVVGQLHNKTEKYQMLRKYLTPIRDFILNSATHDGWGNVHEESYE